MNHQLIIDRELVRSNIEQARNGKEVCLMVKANCYGLGNDALKMLIDLGYRKFGVSTIEEALNVRSLCADSQIIIVSYIDLKDLPLCIENDIEFTVYDFTGLNSLNSDHRFHIKIDTNMGRLGFKKDELESVYKTIIERELQPVGIFSHLACASDEEKTQIAIDNFKAALKVFASIDFKYIHLFNSYGSVNYDTDFDNMIRLGIGMWGYAASIEEQRTSRVKFKPALSLKLTVAHSKQYAGYISYDHIDYVNGNVYTVPIGYHDGFYRSLSGYVVPNVGTIVGKVNMCQHMVLQAKDTKSYKRGDSYFFFQGSQLYDVCKYANITTYEFLVALSNRLARKVVCK